MPESFSWLMFVPAIGADHDLLAVAHSWLVVGILVIAAWLARGKILKANESLTNEDLIPDDHLTLRCAFELLVEFVYGLMEGLLGDRTRKFFWLIGTLFIYILFSNLLGLVPGLLPPTENISNNLAMSITVFVVYNYVGVREHGPGGYLKHFMGPVLLLAPLMLVLELVAHCVRPISLAVRLFGNISGDHLVLSVFSQTIPAISWPIMGVGIPSIFMFLGIFVSVVQAFVFSLLSISYLSMATAHDH